jgi:hypothetical protein
MLRPALCKAPPELWGITGRQRKWSMKTSVIAEDMRTPKNGKVVTDPLPSPHPREEEKKQ